MIQSIGPAGENRVNAASIEHGFGSGASRGGVGAAMGDNLVRIADGKIAEMWIEYHEVKKN